MRKRISILQKLTASFESLKWIVFFLVLMLIRLPIFGIDNFVVVYALLGIAAAVYILNVFFIRPRVSFPAYTFIEYIFHTVFITILVIYSGYLDSFFLLFFYITVIGVAIRLHGKYSSTIFVLTLIALIFICLIDPVFDPLALSRILFISFLMYGIGYSIRHDFQLASERSVQEQVRIKKLQETSRLKDEFVFTVAHDLRSPLSAVMLQTEMLRRNKYGKLPPRATYAVQMIENTTNRLVNLINDLLSVSQIESRRAAVQRDNINIHQLLLEVADSLMQKAKERNITIKIKTSMSVHIITDEIKCKEIFTNLIDNAIKYSKDNGKIFIQYRKGKRAVLITIADNGLGIPENEKQHVFEKFYRSQTAQQSTIQGTGLGLFITKRLVQLLRGKIWFRSHAGKGTTFFVALPISVSSRAIRAREPEEGRH